MTDLSDSKRGPYVSARRERPLLSGERPPFRAEDLIQYLARFELTLADLEPEQLVMFVAARNAAARSELVPVRFQDPIAGQEIAAGPAGDRVVAAAAHDQVGATAAVDDVVVGAPEEPIVTVAAVDLQGHDQALLLEVARIDAPLADRSRIHELRVAVDDVIASAGVDDGLLDAHHLVEDVGIVLGKAMASTVEDFGHVRRFGSSMIPMDEALSEAVVDVSGRPYLVYTADYPQEYCGEFPVALLQEFLYALAHKGGLTLHASCRYGANSHHMAEALFKALGKALQQAFRKAETGEPASTKGVL